MVVVKMVVGMSVVMNVVMFVETVPGVLDVLTVLVDRFYRMEAIGCADPTGQGSSADPTVPGEQTDLYDRTG